MRYGLKFLDANKENSMPDSLALEFEKELEKRLNRFRAGQDPMSTQDIALCLIALRLKDRTESTAATPALSTAPKSA
jgi:hypothetical protein